MMPFCFTVFSFEKKKQLQFNKDILLLTYTGGQDKEVVRKERHTQSAFRSGVKLFDHGYFAEGGSTVTSVFFPR